MYFTLVFCHVGMSGSYQANHTETDMGQRNLSMRSPMQWDNTSHAGFCKCTKGKPWMPPNPQFKGVNVEVNIYTTLVRVNLEVRLTAELMRVNLEVRLTAELMRVNLEVRLTAELMRVTLEVRLTAVSMRVDVQRTVNIKFYVEINVYIKLSESQC